MVALQEYVNIYSTRRVADIDNHLPLAYNRRTSVSDGCLQRPHPPTGPGRRCGTSRVDRVAHPCRRAESAPTPRPRPGGARPVAQPVRGTRVLRQQPHVPANQVLVHMGGRVGYHHKKYTTPAHLLLTSPISLLSDYRPSMSTE